MKEKETRGHLFNLIVYTHEQRRAEYFFHVVKTFISKYPCRVITIQGDKEADHDYLETTDINGSEISETCDHLVVKASSSYLPFVPFTILPHLVPDLPVYLVWGQDPTSDNEILHHLQKFATRLIYDSKCTFNLKTFSKKMLSKIEELDIEFMDVGWAQIAGWRDVISQVFDTEEKISFLNQCQKILIKYNKLDEGIEKRCSSEAIYLQGWLAAQLHWRYRSNGNRNDDIIIQYANPQGDIEFTLHPQKRQSLRNGRIFEIEFCSKDNMFFTLSLAEKLSKVMVYLSTPEKCELPFSLPISDISMGLTAMKEIFYYRTGAHYGKMLHVLEEIDWKEQ